MATKKSGIRRAVIALVCVVALLLLTVIGYVLYVVFDYNRIEDNFALAVEQNQAEGLALGNAYTVMTYNVGFGAYDREFSFFMDTSDTLDGVHHVGEYGKGASRENVLKNTNGSRDVLLNNPCDFYLLQEVDVVATRSYKINQLDIFSEALGKEFARTFAVNYHSAYLFYPFSDPIGRTAESGLATYSRYSIDESVRRSYPLDTGFAKFFDLDRCLSINRIPTANGKELVLINHHMSAYDEGGTIRAQQLEMLNGILAAEYAKGNYVIVGGDFNHDIAQTSGKFPTNEVHPDWVAILNESDIADGFKIVADSEDATCRSCALPYVAGKNYTVTIDGFIVSDNIDATAETIAMEYLYSDHNPVVMTFELK
jgi:endonuclease/exonuclease/phosphatase family metal-dependent hydrolase